MPSPFPGMDPWLEDAGGWLDVHNQFLAYLRDDLNASLAGRYVARAHERVVVESSSTPARGIYPDVHLVRRPTRAASRSGAVAEADLPVVVQAATAEFREAWLEIRDRAGRRLITVIELLSPSNKTPGASGRELYSKKQREVLASDANLVEIDLLRSGAWTLAVPEGTARSVGPFDYLVSVSRPRDRDRFELYPTPLSQRLPRVAVPLAANDRDTVADVQSLLDRCYDRGLYRETTDYARPPVPPLTPLEADWAARLLRLRRPRKKR